MDLLRTRSISKTYGKRPVVKEVDLRVERGEIVGLLGPNGAGKTTTFQMILGLVHPDHGQVLFNGENISSLPVYKRARLGIGYLAQEPSVFRSLSVEENLLAVLEWIPGLGLRQQRQHTDDLMERLHLAHLAPQKAGRLSGGEQRRLEIARVLARDPALILLDEPFTNIDPITVEEIQGFLVKLKEEGIGILLTDHNVREALSITNRSYILVEGKVFRHGKASALVQDPLVRRNYLGNSFSMPGLESGS